MEVSDAIFKRRSIRQFTDNLVDKSVLREIMLAGIYAPTAGNLQPWEFYCYCSPDALNIIKSVSPGIIGNPKAIIVACINEQKLEKLGLKCWYQFAIMDVSMACQNMMLRAFELGLGTCPVASFDAESLQRILALPEGRKPILLIAVGYYQELPPMPKRDESVIHIEDAEYQHIGEERNVQETKDFLLSLLGFLLSSVRISDKEPLNYPLMRLLEAAIKVVNQLIQLMPEKLDTLQNLKKDLDNAISLCFRNDPNYADLLAKVIDLYVILRV